MFLISLSDLDIMNTLFMLLGGLGLFLFGINLMGDSLKSLAGNKIKGIIEKSTNTPLKGIFVGAFVTVILQSSSGTTALTVGLVRAGLMTFSQAVGVIMGANIGTTATAFIIGLNINKYALPIIGVGAIMIFFFKNKKRRTLGSVILGFGLLFYGLDIMGTGLSDIAKTQEAVALFKNLSENPFLGLSVGTLFTAVIQSSSAAIAILQQLYQDGSILLIGAIPILLGSNIGTTVTAILASLGGGTQSKRTAVVHLLFNLFGAVLFMILLKPYSMFVGWIESTLLATANNPTPSMTIAIAHIAFNIIATFILYFLIRYLVIIAKFVIKEDKNSFSVDEEFMSCNLILKSAPIALEFAEKNIVKMGILAQSFFGDAYQYAFENNHKLLEKSAEIENNIDTLDRTIHDYLMKITQNDLNNFESMELSKSLEAIRDFERIGDHCLNLFEFFEEQYLDKQILSEDASNDLRQMMDLIKEMIDMTIVAFENQDLQTANRIIELEKKVDYLEEKNRKRHIQRLNTKSCFSGTVDNYIDILSNLERIGDHCNNIATNIITNHYHMDLDSDDKRQLKKFIKDDMEI